MNGEEERKIQRMVSDVDDICHRIDQEKNKMLARGWSIVNVNFSVEINKLRKQMLKIKKRVCRKKKEDVGEDTGEWGVEGNDDEEMMTKR